MRRREVLTLRLVAVMLAGLFAAGGFLFVGQRHTDYNTTKIARQQSMIGGQQREINGVLNRLTVGAYGACRRLNIERARNNSDWYSSYQADKANLHYDLTVKTLVVASLRQAGQPKRTLEQERETRLFLSKLEVEIDGVRHNMAALDWVPLTDCVEAVRTNPVGYTAPQPLSFVHHPPPRDPSPFVLGPNN